MMINNVADSCKQQILRGVVWLSRIHRCRGFGIQSPWAYRMVRYVINEHCPYYGYADMERALPHLDALTRKTAKLCFRLSNHLQPRLIADLGAQQKVYGAYFRAGCHRAAYKTGEAAMAAMTEADIIRISPVDDEFAVSLVVDAALSSAHEGSMVLLHDIHRHAGMRRCWQTIVEQTPGVVTFDLYYCGLVFFEKKRYKQNYIINF